MATVYHGADVSQFQGAINWATYAANKNFVIIKAGGADAGLYTDSRFATNQSGARAQSGLRVGYYFFGDTRVNAVTAANYFIGVVGSLNNGEILALDIEGAHAPNDSWAADFSNTVKNHYSFNPFCYMSQFITSSDLSWPTTTPVTHLWMANWSLANTDFSETGGVADWGAGHSNYNILQYADNGSIPGISGLVDLDSFISPNNTLADWDALGFGGGGPPPPVPGSLTYASVSDPSMTYTQPAKQTVIVPSNKYDQVLYSNVWTTSVTASSWPQTLTAPATNINQYAYVVGNFNALGDGIPTDFGVIDFGSSGYGQYPGNLPLVFVQPVIDSSGNLTFIVTYTPGGSATVDLTLNYALLAYPNASTAPIPKQRVGQAFANVFPGGNPTIYSTYRRISADSSVGTGTTTLAHGLGGVPNLLFWVQDNSGTIEMQPVTWTNAGQLTNHFGLAMDNTNINFYVDSVNNTKCWYRTYKDN